MVEWERVRALMERRSELRRIDTSRMSPAEREQHRKRLYDLWQEAKGLIEKGADG